MSTESNSDGRRKPPSTVHPAASSSTSAGPSKFDLVQNVVMAPFRHKRDSTRILSDCEQPDFSHPQFRIVFL
jgi:hypothetical protein